MSKSKPQIVVELVLSQEGKCYYCGLSFKNATGYESVSIDHKIPSSRGGKDDINNLAISCVKCNGEKGQMTEAEFKIARQLVIEGKMAKKDIPEYVRYLTLKEKFEPNQ